MLAVNFIIIFLVYMADGSVMVTFIPNKVNTFVLLKINCKLNSLGVLKSLFCTLMTSWRVTLFRKHIKTVFVPHNRCWNYCNRKKYSEPLFAFFST